MKAFSLLIKEKLDHIRCLNNTEIMFIKLNKLASMTLKEMKDNILELSIGNRWINKINGFSVIIDPYFDSTKGLWAEIHYTNPMHIPCSAVIQIAERENKDAN